MKKLILAVAVAGLTIGSYAGEKAAATGKAGCPGKDKACCAEKAAAACPANKAACQAQGQIAKQGCKGKSVQSPKGADSNKS